METSPVRNSTGKDPGRGSACETRPGPSCSDLPVAPSAAPYIDMSHPSLLAPIAAGLVG